MVKSQKCQDVSPTLNDFIRPSDNSCSSHFGKWNGKYATVLQLNPQDNVKDDSYELLMVGFSCVFTITFCYLFYTWFKKYRLRYLLRICFIVFFAILSLNTFCFIELQFQNWLDEKAAMFCPVKERIGLHAKLCSAAVTVAMLCVRFTWGLPLNIKKKLNSTGYLNGRKSSKTTLRTAKQLTAEKLQAGTLQELPPVFPNGWIPILESSELAKNSSKTVSVIGKQLCVFRDEDGKAYVVDAYCPHLGAELAAGGRVVNKCIECPFHGWQFDGETGECLKIPYAKKVPEVAKIMTWSSCEKNGFVFVWYHAENKAPSWEMPSVINVESGLWHFRGRTEHEVHCHLQEIPENGADIAHLHAIHSQSIFSGQNKFGRWIDSLLNCVEHEWQPCGWGPDEERPHIAKIMLNQCMRICGKSLPFFSLKMDIEQIGPATVHLHLESSFGRGVLLQHIISEEPLKHRIIHLLFTEQRFRQFPADLLILSEAIMIERDIAIWNNKRFLRKPILVREDKLITRFRRWYSQFYSEHSPTLKDIKERTLEW